jgi:PKD repeat protein
MGRWFATFFLILLAISSFYIITTLPHQSVKAQPVPPPTIVSVFSSLYSTNNITIYDGSLGPGSQFSIDINIGNAPNFNAFETALFYDPTSIIAASYDVSTQTMLSHPLIAQFYNTTGAFRLSVVNLGSQVSFGSGTLFHVTFKVNGLGASPLVLAAAVPDPSNFAFGADGHRPDWTRLITTTSTSTNPVESNVTTADGYFRNVAGPTSLPPVASFNWSPTKLAAGQSVTFDASASFDPDKPSGSGNGLNKYRWDFGDGSIGYTGPTFSHAFPHEGNYTVLLTVFDADAGYAGMKSKLLSVSQTPSHNLEIHSVALNGISQPTLKPGETLHIAVTILDSGTFDESFNLTISYGPPTKLILPPFTNQTIHPGNSHQLTFNATLSTSGLGTGTYEVDVALIDHPFNSRPLDSIVKALFTIAEPSNVPYLPIIGGIFALIAIPVSLVVLRRRLREKEIE